MVWLICIKCLQYAHFLLVERRERESERCDGRDERAGEWLEDSGRDAEDSDSSRVGQQMWRDWEQEGWKIAYNNTYTAGYIQCLNS